MKADLEAANDRIAEMQQKEEEGGCQEKKLKDLNRQLEFQVEELMEQLDKSDVARKEAKNELGEAQEKIVELEEKINSIGDQDKKYKDLNR